MTPGRTEEAAGDLNQFLALTSNKDKNRETIHEYEQSERRFIHAKEY